MDDISRRAHEAIRSQERAIRREEAIETSALGILRDAGPMTAEDLTMLVSRDLSRDIRPSEVDSVMESLIGTRKVVLVEKNPVWTLNIWDAVEKSAKRLNIEKEKYKVQIIMRDGGGQRYDDYHATITRISDGVALISISRWRWVLVRKTTRKKLDKRFAKYDERQKKLKQSWERDV